MAGHSQFKNIMHKKGRADAARSKLFGKLAREITVAAKLGLPDPAMNPRLPGLWTKAPWKQASGQSASSATPRFRRQAESVPGPSGTTNRVPASPGTRPAAREPPHSDRGDQPGEVPPRPSPTITQYAGAGRNPRARRPRATRSRGGAP